MIISSLVENGKLVEPQRDRVDKWLSSKHGKTVYITFSEFRPARTLDQNAYYWKCIIETIAGFSGDNPNDVHENCKQMFCPKMFDETGKQYALSTTRLTTKEFSQYIERILAYFTSEFGILFPNDYED